MTTSDISEERPTGGANSGSPGVTAAETAATGFDPVAWLVGAIVTALMIQGSAGGPSFLDSGELIAAARELGGIHPPGHPAWLSLAGLAELLPIGAYGARVVWLSALFAGVSAGLMVRIARRLLPGFTGSRAACLWRGLVGLSLGCSASLWMVGTRAEVYTLALATNLWAFDAALRAGDAQTDNRPALPATIEVAIAFALGLLNHHYVTLFTLPAILIAGWPAVMSLVRAPRQLAQVIGAAAFVGLGYLAEPLRALADTEMRWGNPATPQGFWDTVTARHFQRSVSEAQVSVSDNAMVLLGSLADGMGVWLAGAGLIGLGLGSLQLGKQRHVGNGRAIAALWAALVGGLLTKALMAVDTRNPDDHGYILFAAAALALGLAVGAQGLFGETGLLRHLSLARRRWLSTLVVPWLLLLTLLGFGLRTTTTATWLASQRGADHVDDTLRRALPPGGIYLSNYYGLQFNEAAWRIAEGRRPDIVTSHLSFRTGDTDGGASFLQWFKRRHPAEARLAVAAEHLHRAPVGNILAMADQGRMFLEPDPDRRIPDALRSFDGFVDRLKPAGERTLEYNLRAERARHQRIWGQLYQRLGDPQQLDHQTRSVLAWQHALRLALALRRGWRNIARDELTRARALAAKDRTLDRLEARLQLLDGAWRDGDVKRFHRLRQGYAEMDLSALAGPISGL